jgi:hypothetical protein
MGARETVSEGFPRAVRERAGHAAGLRLSVLEFTVTSVITVERYSTVGAGRRGGAMKKFVIVLCLGLLVIGLAMTVAATAQVFPRGTLPRGTVPAARQSIQDQRAEIIKERLDTIIARFNNNKERHIATYNAAKATITQMVSTLSAKGYDTSKLATDLQAWDAMVVKMANDYASLIGLLQTAEQYAPYASQGQFLAAMNQARSQLRVVRKDSLDVRNEYQTVIRPDVQALAGQTPKAPATTP